MVHDAHAGMMRTAAIASLVVSILLVTIKTIAFFASHSVSVLAALADSALDLFTAGINLVAIRSALTPADEEHRFGHGKAEPLAGLAQGAFIAASALFLVIQAAERFLAPQPVTDGRLALGVMLVSIVAALGLVIYERRVVAATGSVALGADQVHYTTDLITNAGVVVALVLSVWFGWESADPLIALVVAAYMVFSAWGVFQSSFDQLMDKELGEDSRTRIRAIVMQNAAVRSMHDLRTRAAGVHSFIQLHIELDPAISLMGAHEVSDAVEHQLMDAFPNAEVIIHQDPAGVETPPELERVV
jgi:ferrous-iron efflux pump FieF